MDGDHGRALQRVRCALVASLVLSLGAGAHVVGGGDLPDPLLVGLAGALVLAVASLLGRRRLRLRTLVPVLGAGQVLLHAAFAALTVPPAGAVDVDAAALAPAAGHGAHAHGALLLAAGGGGVDAALAAASAGSAALAGSAGMVAAHLAATLVTALAAVSADRAWAAAVARLAQLFPALGALLVDLVEGPAPRAQRTPAQRCAVPRAVVVGVRPRRGPPAAVPAA
ncbi:hypothetical protein WDZ16_13860 [Pseudokineococcus marinus]